MSKATKAPVTDAKMMSAELFTLTYGALVVDLLRDLESPEEVNRQLDKIGYNIGLRITDDFLAKNSNVGRCSDMHQVADIISKNALKTYLGITAQVTSWSSSGDEFSLVIENNPLGRIKLSQNSNLVEFVEIPAELGKLCYSQVICGAIRGAMEALHMEVSAALVTDPNPTEIRVKFIRVLHESIPAGYED